MLSNVQVKQLFTCNIIGLLLQKKKITKIFSGALWWLLFSRKNTHKCALNGHEHIHDVVREKPFIFYFIFIAISSIDSPFFFIHSIYWSCKSCMILDFFFLAYFLVIIDSIWHYWLIGKKSGGCYIRLLMLNGALMQ